MPAIRYIVASLVAISLAGICFFGYQLLHSPSAAASEKTHAITASERPNVGALGRIEPVSRIINMGAPTDAELARLTVKEGDRVRKGQPLAYLRSYNERAADRDRIAAKLAEAERLLKATTVAGEAMIREAKVKLHQVETNYPLLISAQEAKVKGITYVLANARDSLKSRKSLFAKKNQSRRSLEDQQAIVDKTEQDLKGERDTLARLKREMPIEKQLAQSAIDRAQADLIRDQADIGVASLREELAVADASAKEATLIAPIDGVVLKIRTLPGERIGDTPVMVIGNTDEMRAVAEVYETDIGRVRLGQTATVTSPALPRPMTGKVVKIGRMIFKNDVLGVDPAAKIDARVVEVRVLLDNSAEVASLTNLSVNVVIDTGGIKQTDEPMASEK